MPASTTRSTTVRGRSRSRAIERGVGPADAAGRSRGRAGQGAAERLDLGAGVPGGPHGAADWVEAALLFELADLELAGEAQGFGDVSPGQVVFKT